MARQRSSAFLDPFNWEFYCQIKGNGKPCLVCIKLTLFLSSFFVIEIGDKEVLIIYHNINLFSLKQKVSFWDTHLRKTRKT